MFRHGKDRQERQGTRVNLILNFDRQILKVPHRRSYIRASSILPRSGSILPKPLRKKHEPLLSYRSIILPTIISLDVVMVRLWSVDIKVKRR